MKWRTMREFMRVFWQMSKEDFHQVDHKLLKISIGIATFAVAAFFWFYMFQGISPF